MTDRGPRARKTTEAGERSLKAEARRYLGTPMQNAMIRGLEDPKRCEAYVGVAYELKEQGEIGEAIYLKTVEKLKEAKE